MSAPKVHYAAWEVEPSESDADGYETLACGAESATKITYNPKAVTCKRCLSALAKPAKEPA